MAIIGQGYVDEIGADGKQVRRVTESSNILRGVQYDDVQATYPNSTTENYAYYLNGNLQATIEVTYTNASKSIFLRARRI